MNSWLLRETLLPPLLADQQPKITVTINNFLNKRRQQNGKLLPLLISKAQLESNAVNGETIVEKKS